MKKAKSARKARNKRKIGRPVGMALRLKKELNLELTKRQINRILNGECADMYGLKAKAIELIQADKLELRQLSKLRKNLTTKTR